MTNRIYTYLLCIFYSATALSSYAQSIGLNWLFRPGMRLSSSFVPKQSMQDTTYFGFSHFNTSLVIPVAGEVEASLSKLNLKANQTFITTNIGSRFLQTNLLTYQKLAHNFSFGVTHVQADVRNGIWFYTFNIGAVESPETFEKIKPFFIGGAAKIVVKGLRTFNIYGVGLTYNYNQIIPVPLFGISRFLSKNIQVVMLLPTYAELIYEGSEKLDLALRADFAVFRSGILPISNQRMLGNEKTSMQYRDARLGLLARYAPSSRVKLQVQAGIAGVRSLKIFYSKEQIRSYNPSFAPFVNVALHINFGNAPINSQLFGNEF